MKGIFIALEGPDGSGKSTITKKIGDYLEKTGINYIITREPGGTPVGEEIRGIILDRNNTEIGNETEALLYAAARAQHVKEKINPALAEGKLVISDRFVFSSLAYQGVGRDLGIDKVKMINDFAIGSTYPDLILFFNIDSEETLKRKIVGDNGDRLELEGNKFHKKVYNGYKDIIEKYPDNVVIIDGSKSIEEVFRSTLVEIEKIIENRRV